MPDIFISNIASPFKIIQSAYWFIFRDNNLLLDAVNIPREAQPPIPPSQILRQHYLGQLNDIPCFALEISKDAAIPLHMKAQPLRQAYDQLGETLFNIAGRAIQVINWDTTHQYCGRCGAGMLSKPNERAKVCPQCNLHNYPRLSPSIIVLIQREHEILLARSPHFTKGVYSILAGFIEPGETAEQAVEREVFEEVGIYIKNIQYQCSQPWPFPDTFMLGFTAEYSAGEIMIDNIEIEAAGWYNLDNLPPLPSKASISRRLIDAYLNKQRGNK